MSAYNTATSLRRSCGPSVGSDEPDVDTGRSLRSAEHTIYRRNGGDLTRGSESSLPLRSLDTL